jgi:Tol biopolymer transport system component
MVAGATRLHRARISDGAIRTVTAAPGRDERWPYWSQDAQRIVFQVGDADDRTRSDLVLFDPAAAVETALVATPNRTERWPGWSPDGRSVVYAFVGGTPMSGVALVEWRNRHIRLAARAGLDDWFLRPNFSPDGERLVAQRRIAGARRGSNLWILAPAAEPRRLTFDPGWIDSKAWFTRRGDRVIYTRKALNGGPYDIFGIDAAGGSPVAVVASAADDHSARPSPTRDEIAFVSNRNGSADIFLARLDGSEVRVLDRSPDTNDLAPRWSPDGERIVATRVDPEIADFGSMHRSGYASARIVVFDREGRQLFETRGMMPDWMPAWR